MPSILYQQLPSGVSEPEATLTGGTTVNSDGVTLQAQTGALGFVLVFAANGPVFGTHTVSIQTAVDGANEWTDIGQTFPSITVAGTYQFFVARGVLDKVRVSIVSTSVTPIQSSALVTIHWLCDTAGIALN